ncbi:hypothetical protein [Microcoleus sp. OTE_8_concoct_300]
MNADGISSAFIRVHLRFKNSEFQLRNVLPYESTAEFVGAVAEFVNGSF